MVVSCSDSNDQPEGFFQYLAMEGFSACGIRLDGSLACWNAFGPVTSDLPPDGSFKAMSMNDTYACAIDSEDELQCWGSVPDSLPAGKFQSVSLGDSAAG